MPYISLSSQLFQCPQCYLKTYNTTGICQNCKFDIKDDLPENNKNCEDCHKTHPKRFQYLCKECQECGVEEHVTVKLPHYKAHGARSIIEDSTSPYV